MHALVLYDIANVCARFAQKSEEATASSASLLAMRLPVQLACMGYKDCTGKIIYFEHVASIPMGKKPL